MASTSTGRVTSIGEAGRSGKDVSLDCRAVVELRTAGGLEIDISAAGSQEEIRKQAEAAMRDLGVEDAHVTIEDNGALPFVIAARIEAAARRAGLSFDRRALPHRVVQSSGSPKDRVRRSRLYMPGSEPKYILNAARYASDAIILDLEDAVHPAQKDTARLLVRNALRLVDFAGSERMVRINQLPLGLQDLREIVPEAPDVIVFPKVENPQHVVEVDRYIGEIAQRCGVQTPIWLIVILETALGIENAFAIATASERVCALSIGLEDYTADLGVIKTPGGRESLYARMRLVNAAKAAGMQALDSVYGDVADRDGLASWCEASRALGFDGMGCIHPSQVEVIQRAFAPSEAELKKAEKIVAAFQKAQEKGLGVVSLGSKMIDAPVVTRALKLVGLAKKMGVLPVEEAVPRSKL